MPEIMLRLEMDDYDAWRQVHRELAAGRMKQGIRDGPVYRDIDNPNAVLFHVFVEDTDRAMQAFSAEPFKDAMQRATVTDIDIFIAESQRPRG